MSWPIFRPEGFEEGDPLKGRWLVVESSEDRATGIYRVDDVPEHHERIALASSYEVACDFLAEVLREQPPDDSQMVMTMTTMMMKMLMFNDEN